MRKVRREGRPQGKSGEEADGGSSRLTEMTTDRERAVDSQRRQTDSDGRGFRGRSDGE